MPNYDLEFILSTYNASQDAIKNALREFSEKLEILALTWDDFSGRRDFKIHLSASDPTVIFDLCAQFGRIKSVKVNEKE